MTPGFDNAEYEERVRAFPPRPIHDWQQLEATEAEIEKLLAIGDRSAAQEDYLDLLSTLVRDWEDRQVVIPAVAGVDLIRFLLEQHDLPARALAPIFGTPSIVSEVLSGKRALQAKHIQQLAAFFHVSPAAFFPVAGPTNRRAVA